MLPNREELTRRYSTLSNDQLLEILYNKADYTDEAIDVVHEEISKRHIKTDELEAFVVEKKTNHIIAEEMGLIPLTVWEKLFFFFGWFIPGIFGNAFRMNYSEDGMETKIRQSKIFRIAGFTSLLLNIFISLGLNLSEISSWMLWFVLSALAFWIASKIKITI